MKKINIKKLCMGCMKEKPSADGVCPHCGFNEAEYSKNNGEALPLRTVLENKYVIGKQLGNGGFGKTYVAYDMNIGQKMCIKEIFPVQMVRRNKDNFVSAAQGYESEFENYIEKAHDEALCLSEFNELPCVVSVRDYFEDNRTAYIVMDFVEGKTLREYLKENDEALPVDWVLEAVKPVLETLAQIHRKDVIHRDISPDNMILTNDGKLVLIDFGAAREYSAETSNSLSVIIKHGYAPIEQYSRSGKQGPWTDIYALAATIYRMITGKVLEDSTDRVTKKIAPFDSINIELDQKITEALTKALSIDYNKRPQHIKDFYKALYGVEMPTIYSAVEMCEKAEGSIIDGDMCEAFSWYEKAAQIGNPKAMYKLACMYGDGIGIDKNYTNSIKWHTQAAKIGITASMIELGYFYGFGVGVKKDIDKALLWCKKAAERGEESGFLLYTYLCNGDKNIVKANDSAFAQYEKIDIDNISPDELLVRIGDSLDKGQKKYYKGAAEYGNTDAMVRLGCLYHDDDIYKAIEWYQKAFQAGNLEAMCLLGNCYENGYGVEENFDIAFEMYQNAAKHGNANGMWHLGWMYELGLGAEQSDKKALEWYKKTAEAGDPYGWELCGDLLHQRGRECCDELLFAEPNYIKSEEYFEAAFVAYRNGAEAGEAGSMRELARMFEFGEGTEQDYRQALYWYEKADMEGAYCSLRLSRVLYQLGEEYFNGTDKFEQDYVKAEEYFSKAANKGNSDAMCRLGNIYGFGKGVEKNKEIAFTWYKKAAEMKNAWGMRCLGLMFEYGEGTEQDYREALRCYENAEEAGDEEATKYQVDLLCKVGEEYYYGTDKINRNYSKAKVYFEKAANKGNSDAMCYLGEIYEDRYWQDEYGECMYYQHLADAFEWYKKAAELGNAWGMRCLAKMYECKELIEYSKQEAMNWYDKAEIAGDTEARELYGRLLCSIGMEYKCGINENYTKAIEYFERAVDKGNTDAMCELGNIYELGYGVQRSPKRAFEWYRQAAEHGDSWGMQNLGHMYECGIGTIQNYEKAISWYEKTDVYLFGLGSYCIGDIYYDGRKNFEQDYAKAWIYFKKAANQGNSDAMCRLGNMCEYGKGVAIDLENAFIWYKKAADKKNLLGMRRLANMYKCGKGTEQDYSQALYWYEKVASVNSTSIHKESAKILHKDLSYKLDRNLPVQTSDVEINHKKCKNKMSKSTAEKTVEKKSQLLKVYQYADGLEDLLNSLIWYETTANLNDKEAKDLNASLLYQIGEEYYAGTDEVRVNYTKARDYFEQAVEQGSTDAMCSLGKIYQFGLGIEKNIEKAVKLYKRAAESGNIAAMCLLGDMYMFAICNEYDCDKAMYWYGMADEKDQDWVKNYSINKLCKMAKAGNIGAMCRLGDMFMCRDECRDEIKYDYSKAIWWYEEADDKNHDWVRKYRADILYKIAEAYYMGEEGIECNYVKAKIYFEQAAELGNAMALSCLGDIYAFGRGVEKNTETAFALYEKASQYGNTEAMYSLARMYRSGEEIGYDKEKALYWYEKAAKGGHIRASEDYAEWKYRMGKDYYHGTEGSSPDYAKAKECFEKAVDVFIPARTALGIIYYDGKGVEKNYNEALRWFKNAAEDDNVLAMLWIGIMYENGEGVERSYEEALNWYRKAENKGDSRGKKYRGDLLYKIGEGYYHGTDKINKDYTKAKEYFEQAAEAGNASAMPRLGHIYEFGEGVEKNIEEAFAWYKKSAEQKDS